MSETVEKELKSIKLKPEWEEFLRTKYYDFLSGITFIFWDNGLYIHRDEAGELVQVWTFNKKCSWTVLANMEDKEIFNELKEFYET